MSLKSWHTLPLLAFFALTGCSNMNIFGAGNTYVADGETDLQVYEEQETLSAPVRPIAQAQEDNASHYINYRNTSANYKSFGERTASDQDIVTSGVGSNMSAAIPPTIDEEVSDYEDEVNASIAAEEAGSENYAKNSENNGQIVDDPVEDWLAEEGNTLKGLLTDWSERAGWRLIWNSNRNYKLAAGAMFRGRFADVCSALIRTFARARPAPIATFYKGNRVLVVETMEDENAYD